MSTKASQSENPDDETREQPAVWVSLQTAIQFAIKFVRGFAIPKLLTPTLYGLYSSINVALQYAKYVDCGGVRLMNKRLPAVMSRAGEEGFRQELARGLSWVILTGGLGALALWLLPLVYSGEHLWFYQIGFPLAGAILLGEQIRKLFMGALRAEEEYKSLAQAGIFMAVLGTGIQVGLLWVFGVFGLISGLLVTQIVVLAFVLKFVPWPGLTWLNLSKIKEIFLQGFQLQGLGLASLLLGTTDRLFLLGYFSKKEFGFYSLGLFVANTALSFTSIFRTVIHPKFMRLFEEGKTEEACDLMDDALISYAVILMVGFPIGYILLYPVIGWILPDYTPALPTFYLLAGFAVVQGPFNMLEPFFIARDREVTLATYYIVAAAVAAAANAVVIWLNGSVEHIILASVVGFLLLDGLLLYDFERERKNIQGLFKYLFYLLASSMVVGYWYFIRTLHPDSTVLRATGRLTVLSGIVLTVCAILIWFKRQRILAAFRTFW